MKRYQKDIKNTFSQWKRSITLIPEDNDIEYYYEDQVGRFRKTHAFDCGKTKCGVCHCDKFPKRKKTNQELKSLFSFKEQLNEVK